MVIATPQKQACCGEDRAASAAPARPGRNEICHCGSGGKYKRCCLDRDESAARKARAAALPPWLIDSRKKLYQFEKYACNVFGVPHILQSFSDSRQDPTYPTFDVANSLFHAALLRLPSINALEGDLKEADFQQLLGFKPQQDVKAFSAEVIGNVLDKLDLDGPRKGLEDVIWKAERNKAFREGSYATLRCVAIDGWEPFASYDRCCPQCLQRLVPVKNPKTGEVEKRVQYYHRFVVAMLIGPTIDVVLAIEPVRNEEARREIGLVEAGHEGELTAGLRLIDSLHETYGSFIDAIVCDALYANGPVMTKLDGYGYGGFIVLKKEDNEPLKEALALWDQLGPCDEYDDHDRKEHIVLWDIDNIETLGTYKGKVRAIKAVVTHKDGTQKTWCLGIVGDRARKVGRRAALKITRSRWHIENTAFNQWVTHWNLSHVFRHSANALMAVLLLWSLVFNLLQLFIYRRLKRARRPKDPTDTIRHIVEVMARDLGSIPEPILWSALLDSS